MKEHRRYRIFSGMVLMLLAAAVLLHACGNTDKKSTHPASALAGATATGIGKCTSCHTVVAKDWLTSRHANLDPAGNLYSVGVPTSGQVTAGSGCTSCHDPNGDSNDLTDRYTGYIARPVIGCEACHGPGSLHADAGGSGAISLLSGTYTLTTIGTTTVSGQFAMCTSCHELLDTAGTGTVAATHTVTVPTGAQYTITDTHFATPGDFSGGANVNDISGYAMDYAAERVCTNCHNPHKTADINNEWARSGHADKTAAGAWAHYNWSCDAANCGAFGDRTTCQRCHTTTGFAGYAQALESGNTALATAMWTGSTPQLQYDPNFKPEMLQCRGCHIDYRGTLRNPGAYKASYKLPVGGFPSIAPITADVSYQYPDIGASNVCMPCHTARGSGRAISSVSTAQSFTNFGFPDGHYLSAGGTMFKGTAYEFIGRNYTDPATFMHSKIGTSAASGTGTMGPCIGCHMDRTDMPGNHLYEPISRSTGAVVVTSEVCFTCHAGSSIEFGLVVEEEEQNYEFALEALEHQLLVSTPSFSFVTTYPYFTNTNWLTFGDTDATGNSGGKNTMGAAFNFSLLHHEPGAYVHNSRYVKRIIYDSIDWIDDGRMNYSVGTTINATCSSTPSLWCQGAKSYLLYGAPDTSAERP